MLTGEAGDGAGQYLDGIPGTVGVKEKKNTDDGIILDLVVAETMNVI